MYSDSIGGHLFASAAASAETLSASAAVHATPFYVMKRCRIKRLKFLVTTLVAADATAPAVEFNQRPTPGSGTGEVLLGTLTIPDATAVGVVIYKDITPVVLNVGDELVLEHSVQAVDGSSAAGAGYYGFEIEDYPEEPGNNTEEVESA